MKNLNNSKLSVIAAASILGMVNLYAVPASYSTTSGITYNTQPLVNAIDEHGNIDLDYVGDITLSSNGDGVLSGTKVQTAVSGEASFTGLSYASPTDNSSYELDANATDLTGANSNIISRVIATQLIFTTQATPTSVTKNVIMDFTTDPVVKAVDANEHVDTDYTYTVTISENGVAEGNFTNNSVDAVAGVSTFTGLTFSYGEDETFQLLATGEDTYSGEDFSVNSSDIIVSPYQAPTPTATPTQTPEPEENAQLVDSDADELQTDLELDGVQSNDEFITLSFNKKDGTKTTLNIPQIQGKTINTVYSPQAIEFTMDKAVASYNNNGTTEHSIQVGENKPTVAVSYITGSFVEFTPAGSVQTTVKLNGEDNSTRDILIVATPEGYSQNSISNESNVTTRADSTIIGTQTIIDEDGDVIVDTPVVVSSLDNNITTSTTLDLDGSVVISALRVKPDGTQEIVEIGSFKEGSEVNIQNLDGAVIVEITTELGTERFTLRSGRR